MVAVLIEQIVRKRGVEKPVNVDVLLNERVRSLIVLATTERVTGQHRVHGNASGTQHKSGVDTAQTIALKWSLNRP